uniref:DUF4283 domain-containing protein n=1 Tax=Tanacetum cinerariifolium TaxID=118510 RepID=A0A6L2P5M7_TANCI|nr:hypothetical protein [Tanacetum cinerariifolium]
MVNDTSCYTNVAPIELNNSSKVILPMAAIDEVNARFVNTLYGFPIGKKLAFPMVENYVKHAWAKFRLKRAMMHHGAFMFQFDSQICMEKKELVSKVPLWVLMHNVPILTYSKVGLDFISAKVASTMRYLKIFDHLESVCPMKPKAGPMKNSELKTDVMKDKQPVHSTGNNKGKHVSTQRCIKGYHVNIPKTKLVYRAVVKPQAENNVACNLEQSSDTTKKPSPSDSSKEGKSTFVNDDISLAKLRSFVVKSKNEELVLEYVGNNDINGCILGEEKGDKISTMKTNSSMEVLNEDSDTDVDEVFLPNDGTTFPSSSGSGGQPLEEDDYDAYEDQFDDYPSLFQDFCDQFDFKVKVGFNSLVHSLRALSALRRSGLRTASTAAKPCQGDSSEFYLITDSIHADQRRTVVLATLFNESEQRHFRSFITNINLQESRRLQLLAKRTSIHNSMPTLQTHHR